MLILTVLIKLYCRFYLFTSGASLLEKQGGTPAPPPPPPPDNFAVAKGPEFSSIIYITNSTYSLTNKY